MEGLKLVIGGDVSAAIQAQKTLVKEVEKGADKIDSTYKKTFTSVGSSIKTIVPAVRPAIQAVSKLGDSIETLRAKLLARKSFLITETDISKIKIYNGEIKALEKEILRLQSTGTNSFGEVGKAGGKAFSALRQIAFILPGIGIAGILGGISEFVVGLFSTSKAAQEAADKLKELVKPIADIREEAAAGSQEELSKVTALSNAVLDQTKSYGERNNALNQLKKINESYFGDLTLETAKLGILKDRVDEYTKAIINQAIIKSFSDNIGKVAVELSKQEKAFNDAGKAIDKARKKLKASKGDDFFFQNIKVLDATADFADQGKVVGKLRDQMFELRTAIQEAVNTSLDFRPLDVEKKIKDGADETQKFINKAKQLAEALEKIGFVKPADITVFDSLETQLTKARKIFSDFASRNLDLNKDFFKIEPTFSEPSPSKVQEFLTVIEEGLQKGIIERGGIKLDAFPISITTDLSQNAELIREFAAIFKSIGQQMPAIDLDMPAGFNENVFVDSLRKMLGAGRDATKEELIKLAGEFEKGIDRINKILQSLAVEGISTFGEALGTALAGGDVANVFKNFAGIVADGLTAIGKQMIALSPVIAALKVAIETLNPALLLPAGVALVAIGAALRATLNKGITGFAQGGLVFGPTMGMVGEGLGTSRSNPEVIAPLDQLKGLLGGLGGGPQVVVLMNKIRGKDLILSQSRGAKSQRRLGA